MSKTYEALKQAGSHIFVANRAETTEQKLEAALKAIDVLIKVVEAHDASIENLKNPRSGPPSFSGPTPKPFNRG